MENTITVSATFSFNADYICDGIADEIEINAAIEALPESGGKIILDGTFKINAPIIMTKGNVVLAGSFMIDSNRVPLEDHAGPPEEGKV